MRILLVGALAMALLGVLSLPSPAYPRPGGLERVSVAQADGAQGNGFSFETSISSDGRYVAFRSEASNLVPDDTNGRPDIFVHDRATGSTDRVSVGAGGAEANGFVCCSDISADGRYVAFSGPASNLVPEDTNDKSDVFLHDRETGVTERVSVGIGGAQGNGPVFGKPSISADGRYVAFYSQASNLVPADTNSGEVFVRDRLTEVTERVAVDPSGAEANDQSAYPSISADGRYVAFHSRASNLVPGDANSNFDVFVRDRQTGVIERVSEGIGGADGNDRAGDPSISADGRYVAYHSTSSNLVPGDTNGIWDVFVHDRETGTTERVSVGAAGSEGDWDSAFPKLSADGRYVTFWSMASNLVPEDTNCVVPPRLVQCETWVDVFVHDRETGAIERVSVGPDASQANGDSYFPSISGDGRFVAFHSLASNLVPGSTNGIWDVFVRDRGPSLGVGELSAVLEEDRISVSGLATFSGSVLASVTDPPGDGLAGAGPAGAELTGASLTHRPEQEDLLIRLRLKTLPHVAVAKCVFEAPPCPGVNSGAGAPGVLYALRFQHASATYEIRVLRAATTALPPATPHFALYRCDPDCTEATPLSGGIGTTGSEVLVSVPLGAFGAQEGAALTMVQAFTALGEAGPGALVPLDEANLPDTVISTPQVSLGIVPSANSGAEKVVFDTAAVLEQGSFSGALDGDSVSAGEYEVWARACLGDACGPAVSGEVAQ